MKIKDLISTNNSYDWFRDDAIIILEEFASLGCYSQGGKTYFLVGELKGTWQDQLETVIVDTDGMVDAEIDKLFDYSLTC